MAEEQKRTTTIVQEVSDSEFQTIAPSVWFDEKQATVFISGTYEDIEELREGLELCVNRLKELDKESLTVVIMKGLPEVVGFPLRNADADQVTRYLMALAHEARILRDVDAGEKAKELARHIAMRDADVEELVRPGEIRAGIVPKLVRFTPELPGYVGDLERLRDVTEKQIRQLEAAIESATTVGQQYELLDSLHRKSTPSYLIDTLGPYLAAIGEIQNIINEIQGKEHQEVVIESIVQQSPISVSLDGASQAVQVVTDTVVPWRRKHAQEMARLATLEKQAEIESKKAEILEKRARAAKDRAEAGRLAAEAAKQREEAERMKLENEKLRVELHRAKIQLALDILAQVAPDLPETEKIAYTVRLLAPLDTIVSSELEISTGK
jgi:hypothetical protein